MRIGIDIDDTLVSTNEAMLPLIEDYKHKHMTNEEVKSFNINNIPKKHYEKFINLYFLYYLKTVPLKENAMEVINRLKDKGHTIYFITARSTEYLTDAKDITVNYLTENNIPYDKLIFSAHKYDKCLEHNIDIMIDDLVKNLESLEGTNTIPILFNSLNNQNYFGNIKRVNSWLEIEQLIGEITK